MRFNQNAARAFSFAMSVCVSAAASPLQAQSKAVNTKTVKEFMTSVMSCKNFLEQCGDGVMKPAERFVKLLADFDEIEKELGITKFGVSLGYEGHQSYHDGADRKYSQVLGVETAMSKDLFPNELRFKAATNLVMGTDKYNNELSSILLNYDHYLDGVFEAYVFTERFADSYMGIKQRFEIGGGMQAEFKIGDPLKGYSRNPPDRKRQGHVHAKTAWVSEVGKPKTDPTIHAKFKREQDVLEELAETEPAFREMLGCLKRFIERAASDKPCQMGSPERKAPTIADVYAIIDFLEQFAKSRRNLDYALIKRRSPLKLGLAASVFSEIEQASLAPFSTDAQGNRTAKSITMDPVQRYRLTVRPSIEWTITDQVAFHSGCYFKLPLFGKTRGIVYESPDSEETTKAFDYRIDWYSEIKFTLAKHALWGGNITMSLNHEYHYDNAPPSLPNQIGSTSYKGLNLAETVSANKHHYVMMKIGIAFD